MDTNYYKQYLKYKKQYLIIKRQEGGKKKKDRPSPSESATKYEVGTKKRGNDGNMWIIIETANGVKRWKKLNKVEKKSPKPSVKLESKKDNEMLKFDDIMVLRNNSYIVSKAGKKNVLTMSEDGDFNLTLSSKYVPQADGLVIDTHFDKLNAYGAIFESKYGKVFDINFKHNGICYLITVKFDGRNKKIINTLKPLFEKYNKPFMSAFLSEDNCEVQDSFDITKEHHYGTLVLLTDNTVKELKKGEKYYIVYDQSWNRHYKGESIAILDFNGYDEDKKELDGVVYDYDAHRKKYNWFEASMFCRLVFGSGDDPIHIIVKFREGFEPPIGLENYYQKTHQKANETMKEWKEKHKK